jgi:hypothetical protein
VVFDMVCSCTAAFQFEVPEDRAEAAWLLASRFMSAHASCGFVSPLFEEYPTKTKKLNIIITPDQDI